MSKTVSTRKLATLSVRLEKAMQGIDAVAGALTRVYPADERKKRPPQTFVIPIGGSARWADVDVEPGDYVIEARLPSGVITRQQVSVPPSGAQITLHGPETTSENLGWQILAAPQGEDIARDSVSLGVTAGARVTTAIVDDVAADSWLSLAALAWSRGVPTRAQALRALGAIADGRKKPDWSSGGVSFHRWSPPRPKNGFREAHFKRTFAIVERPGVLEIVTLPIPWVIDREGNVATVELAVPNDPAASLGITVQDALFGSVIGYLGTGCTRDAGRLLEYSRDSTRLVLDALYNKVINPYAAAIGAYVLVQRESRRDEWEAWLGNLSRWFAWLPDGAALRGLHELRRDSNREATAAFGVACERGLPICSAVAYDLFGALCGFETNTASRFDVNPDLLVAMRAVLMCLQPRQAFSILRFEDESN